MGDFATEIDGFVVSAVAALPLQSQQSGSGTVAPALDQENLYQAIQELGTALRKERAYSHQLAEELEKARSHQLQDARKVQKLSEALTQGEGSLQAALAQARTREQELSARGKQLEAYVRQLQLQLHQQKMKGTEDQEKLRFERELQKTAQQYTEQRVNQFQAENEDLKGQLNRLTQENQRHLRILQEAQEQLRSESRNWDMKQNSLLVKISELNAETGRLRAAAAQTDFKARFEDAAQKLARLHQAYQQLRQEHARLQQESANVEQLKQQLDSEQNDKHMVLASLRTAEIKLSRAESRIADLELDLERMPKKAMGTGAERASAPWHSAWQSPEEEPLVQAVATPPPPAGTECYIMAYPSLSGEA